MRLKKILVCLFTLMIGACNAQENSNNLDARTSWYQPTTSSTWHWQLQGEINPNLPVDIYDIDLFDSPKSLINTLHGNGKKVICYFSAGSYENWRDDAQQFDKAALGSILDGWEDEQWLDVRSDSLKPIMTARLDLAKQKDCDGVEPDNVDGYANESGFKLTANDQLNYNKWLAEQAHERGLAIGLKNNLDQIEQLVGHFDFAVNEQCFEYEECERLASFTQADKAVFNAEYHSKYFITEKAKNTICERSRRLKFSTLILNEELDSNLQLSCS
ncbi:endo alpha-1,4 polygalactosaminidase [Leucothrix arctica]|uniref:Endo alpha-1,4 polygalactosaminidase n=1 Tax=Leucothrix arctica TaxID=1481894 RepID=A0A317C8M1_9GAMM|nr:endo alpha-1,4 polygalactosaminidase [Leucothrix arctica]PWQ94601.1 endo alpha-1,4 polygalactosaminidase [Leucothrix arctica]